MIKFNSQFIDPNPQSPNPQLSIVNCKLYTSPLPPSRFKRWSALSSAGRWNGSSQGQNLALTVLFGPHSESGIDYFMCAELALIVLFVPKLIVLFVPNFLDRATHVWMEERIKGVCSSTLLLLVAALSLLPWVSPIDSFFFLFSTIEPGVEWYKGLWAYNASPPRNRFTFLRSSCFEIENCTELCSSQLQFAFRRAINFASSLLVYSAYPAPMGITPPSSVRSQNAFIWVWFASMWPMGSFCESIVFAGNQLKIDFTKSISK